MGLHDFGLQRLPNQRVQLDKARRHAGLRDVARARQIDGEFADRMAARPGRQHHHTIGKLDRLLDIVLDDPALNTREALLSRARETS